MDSIKVYIYHFPHHYNNGERYNDDENHEVMLEVSLGDTASHNHPGSAGNLPWQEHHYYENNNQEV